MNNKIFVSNKNIGSFIFTKISFSDKIKREGPIIRYSMFSISRTNKSFIQGVIS
jgi:hypothetical protein